MEGPRHGLYTYLTALTSSLLGITTECSLIKLVILDDRSRRKSSDTFVFGYFCPFPPYLCEDFCSSVLTLRFIFDSKGDVSFESSSSPSMLFN